MNSCSLKHLVLLILILFMASTCQSQNFNPFNTGKTLADLLKENRVSNFKAGSIATGIRNDTIVAIFYFQDFNYLFITPLGHIKIKEVFSFEGDWEPFVSFDMFGKFLGSRTMTSFKTSNDSHFILYQTLTYHTNRDLKEVFISERLLFYSLELGLYKIVYLKDSIRDIKNWPYGEGDFIY